ncbi:uncharacterized protein LOC121971346 [Zingiber officinale]|uniref:uncharacterized protein LOC121971346 n=1 Tax=Zingiber officinale TaxID=94328 RepID=UPI001C4A777C|nr:uncharacterized protein LOC121971346 [Zingiber officinale]
MEAAAVLLPLPRSRPLLPQAAPISLALARTSGSSRLRGRTCGRRQTAGIDAVLVDGAASADLAPVQITWQIAVGALAGITPFVVAGIEFSKRIIAQRKCGVCGGSGLILLKDKSYARCPGCGGFLPWQSWKRFFTG